MAYYPSRVRSIMIRNYKPMRCMVMYKMRSGPTIRFSMKKKKDMARLFRWKEAGIQADALYGDTSRFALYGDV